MPRQGLLLLRRMGAVPKDVRRSAFGGTERSSANLCLGHNQRLKMQVTKKELREERKEVKRHESIRQKTALSFTLRTAPSVFDPV
jgi:hypothetical protein